MIKVLAYFDRKIEDLSSLLLVIAVGLMLTISAGAILLRWFQISFLWIDPLVRHLVFISAFLGGVLSTGRGQHIGIDVLSKYLESSGKVKIKKNITLLTILVSVFTLAWLTHAGLSMVRVEIEFGKESFWGIHSSFLLAIIPCGFLLILYRFIYLFFKTLQEK